MAYMRLTRCSGLTFDFAEHFSLFFLFSGKRVQSNEVIEIIHKFFLFFL